MGSRGDKRTATWGPQGGSLIQEGKQLEARILGKGVPMLEERLDHSVPAAGALQNSP